MDENQTTKMQEEEAFEQAETRHETDKKCPACGGTMDFDPETGALLCPFCGNKVEIEDDAVAPERAQELDFDEAEHTGDQNWGAEKRVVICKSCGAESIYDAATVSGECPYCGSNQVMEAGDADTLAPGGICPFRISEEEAEHRFTAWLKRKLFCPRAAKKTAKVRKAKGVYLPYWTFDSDTESTYTARYGIRRVIRTNKQTRVVTHWYHTSGFYHEFINDETVLATERHDTKTLAAIAPFDTESNVAYKPEYLAGFASERYSVGLKSAWEKAKNFIKNRLIRNITTKIKREKHADLVDSVKVKTAYRNITYKYLMLPVWLASFEYKGKFYQFIVNGQTGKVGGKVPISPLRVAIAVFLGIVVIGLIAAAFMNGSGDAVYYF